MNKETIKALLQQWIRVNWPGKKIDNDKVAIVFANYNTLELTSYLLFSIFRILGTKNISNIIAVDNNSKDGSLELLMEFAKEGMIDLISNHKQTYHGPAINQAINYLTKHERSSSSSCTRYIWVLDSDIIILKSTALADAVRFLKEQQAAAIGEYQFDALSEGYAHISSLLIDPCLSWKRTVKPFDNTGAPAANFQTSLRAHGLKVADFPYRSRQYILHLARGTLKSIYQQQDKKNIFYDWATCHAEHHYHGDPEGPQIHQKFMNIYNREVPEPTPGSLLAACQQTNLVEIPI